MLGLAVFRELPWMRDALCTEPRYDPDAWFPSQGGRSVAKAVCEQCGVRSACLAYAIREDIRDGIWGGTSPREREELARSGHSDGGLVEALGGREKRTPPVSSVRSRQ